MIRDYNKSTHPTKDEKKDEYRKRRHENEQKVIVKYPKKVEYLRSMIQLVIDEIGADEAYLLEYDEMVETLFNTIKIDPVKFTIEVRGSSGSICYREAKNRLYGIGAKYESVANDCKCIINDLTDNEW